jgi:hypothetical protein
VRQHHEGLLNQFGGGSIKDVRSHVAAQQNADSLDRDMKILGATWLAIVLGIAATGFRLWSRAGQVARTVGLLRAPVRTRPQAWSRLLVAAGGLAISLGLGALVFRGVVRVALPAWAEAALGPALVAGVIALFVGAFMLGYTSDTSAEP